MKNYLLFLLIIISIASCSEDQEVNPSSNSIPCKLHTLYVDDSAPDDISVFEYDDKGLLVRIFAKNDEVSFIYENGRLKKAIETSSDSDYTDSYEFYYQSDGQVSKIIYSDNINGIWLESRFSYTDGLIQKLEHWRPDANKNLFNAEEFLFTYDNQNIVLIEQKTDSNFGDGDNVVTTYIYDDQLNPFYKQSPFFLTFTSYEVYFSKNNPVKTTSTTGQGYTYSAEYQMEYNEYNLPTKIVSSNDFETLNRFYTYYCN